MRRTLLTVCSLVLLASCGGGGGGGATRSSAANNEACALVADAAAIFGADVDIIGNPGDSPMAADCEFTSADGARSGAVVLFTADSLGGVSPADQVATLVGNWDAITETPLQPVAELGEDARLALELPGNQTQIVFSKGTSVVAVLGSSGDRAMSGEQIARALASAASEKLGAAD